MYKLLLSASFYYICKKTITMNGAKRLVSRAITVFIAWLKFTVNKKYFWDGETCPLSWLKILDTNLIYFQYLFEHFILFLESCIIMYITECNNSRKSSSCSFFYLCYIIIILFAKYFFKRKTFFWQMLVYVIWGINVLNFIIFLFKLNWLGRWRIFRSGYRHCWSAGQQLDFRKPDKLRMWVFWDSRNGMKQRY